MISAKIKGDMGYKKSSSDLDENFGRGVFWGLEFESEVRFLKFSSEGGQIEPPTAKTAILKKCLDFNETRSMGVRV